MHKFLGFALVLAACGLIDEDVTRINLSFPRHDFRIDSGDWRFVGSTLPSLACSIDCAQTAAQFCGTGGPCSASCDEATQTCQVTVTVTLINDFNLATEAPAYQRLDDQTLISVSIDDVFFDISENTLTAATPPLEVYMGPPAVSSPADVDAQLIGTIDPVAARATGQAMITFEGNGRESMSSFMNDFTTPFRVIVNGQVTLHAGDPIPMGRLVGSVQANAHVSL
jgi:hypothetical protein